MDRTFCPVVCRSANAMRPAGEPFELIGVSIATFNSEGLNTGNTVMWPYPDEFVWDEFGVGP